MLIVTEDINHLTLALKACEYEDSNCWQLKSRFDCKDWVRVRGNILYQIQEVW